MHIINELSLAPVYEALDDNEVALQNMMGNRFMGFFEAQITEWKGKLGTVRAVIDLMLEVQRAWCSLESIFLSIVADATGVPRGRSHRVSQFQDGYLVEESTAQDLKLTI